MILMTDTIGVDDVVFLRESKHRGYLCMHVCIFLVVRTSKRIFSHSKSNRYINNLFFPHCQRERERKKTIIFIMNNFPMTYREDVWPIHMHIKPIDVVVPVRQTLEFYICMFSFSIF